MKIVVSDYDTGELYAEIEDATASQISAYSSSRVISMQEDEYIVNSVLLEHENQILDILVEKTEKKMEEK